MEWVPWLFLIFAGVLIGVGAYTFTYGKGFSYLSNDPKACMNCHIMQGHFDSWVKSSHHAVASCNDCHVPHTFPGKYLSKAINGWNHSKAFTLQNFDEPIRITERNLRTLQHNCLTCHDIFVSPIVSHRDVEQNAVNCTACHRSTGHMSLS